MFCFVGIGTCAYYAFIFFKKFIYGTLGYVIPRFQRQSNKDLVKKYGNWAVITGATDGIGLAYAKELAARKVNIVLISRTEEKLRKVSAEIENEFSVETKIIAVDFTEGRPVYERIENELKDVQVGILVNNVGTFSSNLSTYDEMSEDMIWDMVNVNVAPVLLMTKMLLPRMKENRKGAIVNVSSLLELQPAPLATLYGATKTFMRNFTKAIQYENRGSGVTIQLLSPSYVYTKLASVTAKASHVKSPTPADYARQAIGTLGVLDHTAGYQSHALLTSIVEMFIPEWIRMVGVAVAFRLMKKLQ